MKRVRQISYCVLLSGLWAAVPAAAQTLCGTFTSNGAGLSFASAVTLTCDTTVNETAGGSIGFASTVDGSHGLITSTSGATTFPVPSAPRRR